MSSEGVNAHQNTEWHELVDSSLTESLSREERKRQGLWWEMIKGEMEYVKDLRTVCEVSASCSASEGHAGLSLVEWRLGSRQFR